MLWAQLLLGFLAATNLGMTLFNEGKKGKSASPGIAFCVLSVFHAVLYFAGAFDLILPSVW